MSMDLALFSQKLTSCKTHSTFLLMLKSVGTSCHMIRKGLCTQSHPGPVKWACHWHSPRCAESSGFYSSFPEAARLQRTWKPDSARFQKTPGFRWKSFSAARYSLESCTQGFVLPYKRYSDQAVPLLSEGWSRESCTLHWPQAKLTWKLMGGGGFFGSILTTLDSTFGGGRKLFFPTWTRQRGQPLDRTSRLWAQTSEGARWPSWDGPPAPTAEYWWTVCSTACPQGALPAAWRTLSGTSARHTWTNT